MYLTSFPITQIHSNFSQRSRDMRSHIHRETFVEIHAVDLSMPPPQNVLTTGRRAFFWGGGA